MATYLTISQFTGFVGKSELLRIKIRLMGIINYQTTININERIKIFPIE